jgi:phage terminase Nu1 subunit (DNA packaging protein)
LTADREWVANSDYTDAPQRLVQAEQSPPGAGEPIADLQSASAREKHWKAQLAELQYKEAAGDLVPAKDVKARLVEVFSSCRTALLAIPSRARQQAPHFTAADILLLENLIREALEALVPDEVVE